MNSEPVAWESCPNFVSVFDIVRRFHDGVLQRVVDFRFRVLMMMMMVFLLTLSVQLNPQIGDAFAWRIWKEKKYLKILDDIDFQIFYRKFVLYDEQICDQIYMYVWHKFDL